MKSEKTINQAAQAWGVTYPRALVIMRLRKVQSRREGPGGREVRIPESEVERVRKERIKEGTQSEQNVA